MLAINACRLISQVRNESDQKLIRAVIRCECRKCRRHSGRCPHTAATRARRTRHPVAMHRYRSTLLCHLCLDALLDGAPLY